MAVLWRSMETAGVPDQGYQNDTAVLPNNMRDKNTFMEKHLRISTPIPSEAEMKMEVKRIWYDRQKGQGSAVEGERGTRSKREVYGSLTPSANSTYFIGLAGFQETNAYIEEFVTRSGEHRIPIFGGGVVVSWSMETFEFVMIKAGFLVLGIKVGRSAFVEMGSSPYASDNNIGSTMQSKVVYHFVNAVRA